MKFTGFSPNHRGNGRVFGTFVCPVCRRSFVQILTGYLPDGFGGRGAFTTDVSRNKYYCSNCHRPMRLTKIHSTTGKLLLDTRQLYRLNSTPLFSGQPDI